MSDDDETRPLGSSVDVGWSNGKPRVVGDDVKSFMAQSGSRVMETKISGRMPRPRSKNPPKPAVTVNYGNVPRNQMDNIDVEEVRACVHFLFFGIITIDSALRARVRVLVRPCVLCSQAPLEDLVLQNAEAMKQFEYLEKSLVSFKETVNEQAGELRQVSFLTSI
jgi:hypothetical protein